MNILSSFPFWQWIGRRRGRRSVKCSGRNSNGLCTRSKYKYTDLCKEIQDDCEYDDDLSSAEEDLCKELGFCVYDSATIAVIWGIWI